MIFVGSMLIALHIDIVIKKDNLGFNPVRGGLFQGFQTSFSKKNMQTYKEGECCH